MAFVQNWPCPPACTPVEQEGVPSLPPSPPVYEPDPGPGPSASVQQAAAVAADAVTEQTTVMVNSVPQQLTQIIQPAQALPLGTLFPELNKPLTSTAAPVTARPTARQINAFAAWEMRLYLNTHPTDTIALSLFRQMAASAGEPNYASTFVTSVEGGRWTWLDDPWPWEYGASSASGTAAEV